MCSLSMYRHDGIRHHTLMRLNLVYLLPKSSMILVMSQLLPDVMLPSVFEIVQEQHILLI